MISEAILNYQTVLSVFNLTMSTIIGIKAVVVHTFNHCVATEYCYGFKKMSFQVGLTFLPFG